MADENLTFRAFGEDVSAGRLFDRLDNKSSDARTSIKALDGQIGDVDTHLKALITQFGETGDTSLFRDIRKDRSTLSLLQGMRKEIAGIGDDSDTTAGKISKNFDRSIGESLGGLPSQLKGAAIVAAVGLGAIMAPAVGAAISGAVLGGVGLGGIIGGIALAAQDDRVKASGKQLGEHLLGELTAAAQPFMAPLLESIHILQGAGDDLTGHLATGFKNLSPLLVPLTHGLEGFVHNLGPGLDRAFAASEPAIRALANELPELGDAVSDFLSSLSDESGNATKGLIGLLDSIEFLTRQTGQWLGYLTWLYGGLERAGDAVHDLTNENALLGQVMAFNLGPLVHVFGDEMDSQTTAAAAAKDATNDYTGSLGRMATGLDDAAKAAKDARTALEGYAQSIADQFDPTANLIHKLQDLKQAQADYTQAVKDHGKKSDEAKNAELQLATAALAVNSAAASAAGTFNGHFSPALIQVFKNAGLTTRQIHDLEKAANDARRAAENFSGTYKAKLIVDTSHLYGSLAAARNALEGSGYVSGRAVGGDVKAGKSYMVGEQGPELVTFGSDGYVHDTQSTRAMLSGASGGSAGSWGGGSVDVAVTVNATGVRDKFAALILEMLRVDAAFRETVKGYVA
jgi:hypothetical protein